jgi:hypothetical protein
VFRGRVREIRDRNRSAGEQAGHCNPAASRWRAAVRPILRRGFASEPRRGLRDATAGRVPGSRMWQCGQCSMVGTLQCISSEALARRDANASLKNRTGCQRQRSVRVRAGSKLRRDRQVACAMEHAMPFSPRLSRRWRSGIEDADQSVQHGHEAPNARPDRGVGNIGGADGDRAGACRAQVATCGGRSTLRRLGGVDLPSLAGIARHHLFRRGIPTVGKCGSSHVSKGASTGCGRTFESESLATKRSARVASETLRTVQLLECTKVSSGAGNTEVAA